MDTEKMDSSTVYSMFEEIKETLKQIKTSTPEKKQPTKDSGETQKSVEFFLSTLNRMNEMTKRFENAVEMVKKPLKHEHYYSFDLKSNKFFLSWVVMIFLISALICVIFEQQETLKKNQNNDLKFRYIKMQGKIDEKNLYRLEQKFNYSDSIKIIRRQVEKYEGWVKERAERIERVKQNSEEATELLKKEESLKKDKQKLPL